MQTLARWLLGKRLGNNPSAERRVETWRELPLELAAGINPLLDVPQRNNLPPNLETDFYSEHTETVELAHGSVQLDVLAGDEQNIQNANQAIATFRAGGPEDQFLQIAPIWFLQAGHHLYESGDYLAALRAYLNSCRLEPPGDLSPHMRRNIAKCLLSLGDFRYAGLEYVVAAEGYQDESQDSDVANCLEMAALSWEAMTDAERYRMGTVNGSYNSTVCSRKAKYLFLNLGDYKSTSRCSILEHDCTARWSTLGASRAALKGMRLFWLYGESPLYVLRCLLVLLIAVGTVFFYSGYKQGDTVIRYTPGLSFNEESLGDYCNALYLAAVTISTLGYGDFSPASGLSKAVAGIASFSGVFLASMFIVALQRRYVGR